MFFCDNCAKERGWPISMLKSSGNCECCKEYSYCNDKELEADPYKGRYKRENIQLKGQLKAVRDLSVECQAMVHERLDLRDKPIVEDLQFVVDKLKAAIGEK